MTDKSESLSLGEHSAIARRALVGISGIYMAFGHYLVLKSVQLFCCIKSLCIKLLSFFKLHLFYVTKISSFTERFGTEVGAIIEERLYSHTPNGRMVIAENI